MKQNRKPKKWRGLTAGSVTGLVIIFFAECLKSLITHNPNNAMTMIEYIAFLSSAYLMIGLPIAIILCLPIGGFIWTTFEKFDFVKRRHAIYGGGIAGLILGLFLFLFEGSNDSFETPAYIFFAIATGMFAGLVTHRVGYGSNRITDTEL
jgi:hypothetical protein